MRNNICTRVYVPTSYVRELSCTIVGVFLDLYLPVIHLTLTSEFEFPCSKGGLKDDKGQTVFRLLYASFWTVFFA